jgi:osmotically-inducible protein OsmY
MHPSSTARAHPAGLVPATARSAGHSVRPRAPKPKPKRRNAAKFPEILLVGDRQRARGVERSLGQLRVMTRHLPSLAKAREAASAACVAVVLVPPLPETETLSAVHGLRAQAWANPLPLFVVVPDEFGDRKARRLYDEGATAVFEWPYEAILLPQMVTDLLGAVPKKGDKAGDAALSRAVRARLQLAEIAGEDVEVKVVAGVATLRGWVKSYWAKQRVENMLIHVPGVVAVLTANLEVRPRKRPDGELARNIRNVMRSVMPDPKTVSVTVRDGAVVLAGSVDDHDDLARLVTVVGNVEGVRSIQNLVTVSAKATKKARGIANRLRSALESMWPSADTTVTVFGHVAVISGRVRSLADKRGIEALALDTPGIGRAVNKLTVRP